jgi:hypothetical protein
LLRFKADARELRRGRETLSNDCIIAITTEGLEAERVNFGAAESESGYDMQAKEMAAMRPESRALPAQIGARRGVPSMAIGAKRFDELSTTSPEPDGSRFTDPDLSCRPTSARSSSSG